MSQPPANSAHRSPRWAPSPTPDQLASATSSLIRRHLAGDERAFSEIMSCYRDRLIRFVYRMIGDRERAEDLVQETFLRIHRHLHRFDASRRFSTWAYTIASNLAKNELRNRKRNLLVYESARRDSEEAPSMQFPDTSTRPDLMFARRRLRQLVAVTVSRLSPGQREVFVLREIQGKSYEEIAQATGSNLGTVKSRLNRARAGFAEMIAPQLD